MAALVEDLMTNPSVNQTIERCRGNLTHLDASRRLLAHSRRLLNRAWWIAGGSDDDLRLTIRDRLGKGALFPAPIGVWSGQGTGRICMVCGTAISSLEVENEMIVGRVTVWAHLPCYTMWREESDRLDVSCHDEAADYLADLRQLVRTRFKDGTLLALLDNRSRAGRGVSDTCAVCSKAIFAAELSQESLGGGRAHAHLLCYRAWCEESRVVRRANGRPQMEPPGHASV
jgi:hypothetical protein